MDYLIRYILVLVILTAIMFAGKFMDMDINTWLLMIILSLMMFNIITPPEKE